MTVGKNIFNVAKRWTCILAADRKATHPALKKSRCLCYDIHIYRYFKEQLVPAELLTALRVGQDRILMKELRLP